MVGPGHDLPPFWVSSQDLDCFVIDNNGFILISEMSQEVRSWGNGIREESSHPTAMSVKERADGPRKQSWVRANRSKRPEEKGVSP